MSFVDGGVELFAILAAVFVCIEILIVDTNPYLSMVDEDVNERVAVSLLSSMVSEDGQGRVEA